MTFNAGSKFLSSVTGCSPSQNHWGDASCVYTRDPFVAVQKLVEERTEGRQFGFVGEARVNVLLLNIALDSAFTPLSRTLP